MPTQAIAIASAKSFGDFVIAHSVLHTVAEPETDRIRLIAGSHLKHLNDILPDDVCVTVVDTGEDRVPAVFDVKKCGVPAAVRSALSLRRVFQRLERRHAGEQLAFDILGARERFIAGGWPLVSPRRRASNIYETYTQFLRERGMARANPKTHDAHTRAESVGIFPESRLVEKKLGAATLTAILRRAGRVGLDAKIFILEGDSPGADLPEVVHIPRDFRSLAAAIHSVDAVVSADSLPAHLAEYFGRPVFVATPVPNEYWLPHACFKDRHWGVIGNTAEFAVVLDSFLQKCSAGSSA